MSQTLYAIEACRTIVPPLEAVAAPNAPTTREHLAACIRKHEI